MEFESYYLIHYGSKLIFEKINNKNNSSYKPKDKPNHSKQLQKNRTQTTKKK